MGRFFIKKICVLTALVPLVANGQNNASYLPPVFTENNRLVKVQLEYPAIDKMYQQYAEKNHVPGYAYGIILDGKLIHTGSGGYIDIAKKFLLRLNPCFALHR